MDDGAARWFLGDFPSWVGGITGVAAMVIAWIMLRKSQVHVRPARPETWHLRIDYEKRTAHLGGTIMMGSLAQGWIIDESYCELFIEGHR